MKRTKELEQKVLHSERLAATGRGIAHMAHEIRNPLTIVGGFARQVLRDANLDDRNRKKLEIIISEIAGLEEFLSDLTDLTRLSEPKKEMGNVETLVEEVSTLLEHEFSARRIVLERVRVPHIPGVLFDPKQIKQVLINIFKNSIEAMPHGGRICVDTRLEPEGIAVRAKDTGIGIAPDNLKNVFHPFFTTKPQGRGLGLAVSRKIMVDHGGDMEIESTKGKGTVCTITLPL